MQGLVLQQKMNPLDRLDLQQVQEWINLLRLCTKTVCWLLLAKVSVRKMSGGMKKRLSIGCAIYADPQVLILDEPTASLDLECKEIIYDYLDVFKKRGGIVVLATHDEIEIENCDALYLLKDKALQ